MYIEDEIAALKKEQQAIILAHYYVPDEVRHYIEEQLMYRGTME